jgi:hypothetical protein
MKKIEKCMDDARLCISANCSIVISLESSTYAYTFTRLSFFLFQYFHFIPLGNTYTMRMLSHIIQEVIERDSANRNRTENEYIKWKKRKAKYLRNTYIYQLYMSERREEVELRIRNEIWSSRKRIRVKKRKKSVTIHSN